MTEEARQLEVYKFCGECGLALKQIYGDRSYDTASGDPVVEVSVACPVRMVRRLFDFAGRRQRHTQRYIGEFNLAKNIWI